MTAILQQRKVPLIDLASLHAPLRDQIIAEMVRVVDSQKFIMGEDTRELEQWIAEYSGTRFAIGCASGTDALFLALLAVGVLPGDRVLTTPYTFFATAGAITRVGATPIFADIDPVTYNLDPVAAKRILERHKVWVWPPVSASFPAKISARLGMAEWCLRAIQRWRAS